MPGAVRLGDVCTGHDGYPSRPNTSASTNVYINNIGAHRVQDSWASHCKGPPCHGSSLAAGSPNVYVNGRKLGRIGDAVACGSRCSTGSSDVLVNDGGSQEPP